MKRVYLNDLPNVVTDDPPAQGVPILESRIMLQTSLTLQIFYRNTRYLDIFLVRRVGDIQVVAPQHTLGVAEAGPLVLSFEALRLHVIATATQEPRAIEQLTVVAQQDDQRKPAAIISRVTDDECRTVRQVAGALL